MLLLAGEALKVLLVLLVGAAKLLVFVKEHVATTNKVPHRLMVLDDPGLIRLTLRGLCQVIKMNKIFLDNGQLIFGVCNADQAS